MTDSFLFLTRIDAGKYRNAAAAASAAAAEWRGVRHQRRSTDVGDAQRRVLMQRVAPAQIKRLPMIMQQ